MKLWLQKWRLISVLAILALVLSGCGEPFLSALTPAGEVAKQQYDLILLSIGIMTLVVVVVIIIFTFAIIKFRRKDDRIPKQVEGSHTLEIVWTVIPIILLLILAVPTVAVTFSQGDVSAIDKADADGNRENLVVNVRAHLYWWEFEYPDLGIVTSQDLVIPTDQKVYFQLEGADVKHSFWVPPLGGKLDTNTDNVNKFWLTVDSDKAEEAGNVFYGKCAELCGPSHALMDFKVKAVPQAEFEDWVANMQNLKEEEPAATTELAQKGEEIFNQSCITCHAVSPSNDTPPTARTAPNLAGFADRETIAGILEHNEEELKNWLKDPEKIKPGNKMTGTYPELSDEDLDALTEYLMGLKVQ
ncbi:cytochrome c oxidase subunit II [Siminovitchia sediminis]|uniref:Cytochrome c oxidase subunit 2 n=1 Tax=Siminovitchia sediminis TaxID=1274353 RepID=A0ABW4KEH0_9BACI